MSRFIDPVGLSKWLVGVPPDELELVEDEFRNVGAGLPFECTSGELVALTGPVAREIAAAIATVIHRYRQHGDSTSMFELLCAIAERLDAAETETTIDRKEQGWLEP